MSLVEVLVAMTIFTVILGITGQAVIGSLQASRRQTARIEALNSGKIGLERLTRDLRAADPVGLHGPTSVSVQVVRGGTPTTVSYAVVSDPASGLRRLDVTEGASPSRTLVRGIAAAGPVFTYTEVPSTPTPVVTSVGVTLPMAVRESADVVLSDDITIRNAR